MTKNQKGILRSILFIFLLVFLVIILDFFTGKNVYDSSVWNKIQSKDTKINILIMGNSHAYTSIDAGVLSAASGKEIDILGSGSQEMVDTLEAFRILLKFQKPDFIILDVYSACLSNRAELQAEKRGILYNNLDGVNNYLYKLAGVLRTFRPQNILDGTFQLFRPTSMWARWNKSDSHLYDEYGFARRSSMVHGENIVKTCQINAANIYKSNEISKLADYNEKAFLEFLKLAQDNKIPVILISTPTLEPQISRKVNRIFQLSEPYECVIYRNDFEMDLDKMNILLEDFYDESHLNQRGAEKFTQFIGSEILENVCGLSLNFDSAFSYKTESVKRINECFIYCVENYSDNCLYQFRVLVNGEMVEKQDYSQSNCFITTYNIADENTRIICYMIPAQDALQGDKSSSRIKTELMKTNDCYIKNIKE